MQASKSIKMYGLWSGKEVIFENWHNESERTMPNQQPHCAGENAAKEEPSGAGSGDCVRKTLVGLYEP